MDALHAFLAALPTPTAVSSAIQTIIRLLLFYTAKSLGASHVLFGTTLTTMSISLISCIAQGGGHVILEEMQEEWPSSRVASLEESVPGTRVIRPLKDVTMKECAAFTWWNGIRVPGRAKTSRATEGITGLTKGAHIVVTIPSSHSLTFERLYHRPRERLSIDGFDDRPYVCQVRAKERLDR